MPYIESLDEFARRMGCPRVFTFVRDRHCWLFENGGRSDGHLHYDPPDDKFQLAYLHRCWYRHHEEQLTKIFRALQERLAMLSAAYGPSVPQPTEHDLAELRDVQQKILALREQIAVCDELLNASPESQAESLRQQSEAERVNRKNRVVEEASRITI